MLLFIVAMFTLIIRHSNRNDSIRAEYWDEQMEVCKQVGYYQTDEGCEPVDHIKNQIENEHTNG